MCPQYRGCTDRSNHCKRVNRRARAVRLVRSGTRRGARRRTRTYDPYVCRISYTTTHKDHCISNRHGTHYNYRPRAYSLRDNGRRGFHVAVRGNVSRGDHRRGRYKMGRRIFPFVFVSRVNVREASDGRNRHGSRGRTTHLPSKGARLLSRRGEGRERGRVSKCRRRRVYHARPPGVRYRRFIDAILSRSKGLGSSRQGRGN